jgi:hypothetical protein
VYSVHRGDQVKVPADPLSHPCRGESSTGSPETFLSCSHKEAILYHPNSVARVTNCRNYVLAKTIVMAMAILSMQLAKP